VKILEARDRFARTPAQLWRFSTDDNKADQPLRWVVANAEQRHAVAGLVAEPNPLTWEALEKALSLPAEPRTDIVVFASWIPDAGNEEMTAEALKRKVGVDDSATALTHLRRAFLLAGESLEGLQAESLLACFDRKDVLPESATIKIYGAGSAAAVALHAALLTDRKIAGLVLSGLSEQYGNEFAPPGLRRRVTLPQVLAVAKDKMTISLK
jgi:hypothetical protein